MKNIPFKKLIILAILLVVTIVLYKKKPIELNKKTKIVNTTPKEDLGIPIEIEKVKKENLIQKISYTGTLYPKDTAELSFKIAAEIIELNFKEGDYVSKGQIIGRLDDASIKAKLDTIQTKIDTLELNLDYLQQEEKRYGELLEGEAIPQTTYDKINHEKNMAEMQLKELRATEAELKTNLKDTILIAPMDGIIRAINASIGEIAAMGKSIVTIDYPRDAIVKVNISESDLEKVKTGTTALLNIKGIDEPITSKVTRVVSSINPTTRIGQVEIGGINSNNGLIFGASVDVEFVIDKAKEGNTISSNSIKQLKDGPVVYKIEDNHAQEVLIKTGIKVGNQVQVLEGLEERDIIATKNIDKLYNGAKVYVFKGDVE